jgi:hypothetical protein
MGLFGAGDPPCPAGSICSGQAATMVGRKTEKRGSRTFTTNQGTKIYHATTTTLRTDGPPITDVYIIKDGSWQKAASTTDGGQTYTFDDDVAGAGLKNELSDPNGGIHRNVNANINKAADRAGVPKETKDTLVNTNPNQAGDNEGETGDTQPITSTSPLVSRDIPASDNTRKTFGNHIYPIDLGKTKQDVIKFTMLEYVPKDFNQSGQFGFSNRDKPENRNPIGTVILPIPGGIQDNNSVSWAGQNMNALEAGLANVALNAIEDPSKVGDATNNILDALRSGGGEAKTAIANAFAGAATGTGGQLLSRTTGAVINPNLELLFSGPALRTFSFSFKMNAREKAESEEIVRIIRFFKQGSAAQRSTSNLFLKSPHTFQIQYLHRGPEGSDNPFMGRIKECALQSIGVNYTPENNYATFKDGEMVSYQVSLNFSELEPVFNDDYSQLDGDADTLIGF